MVVLSRRRCLLGAAATTLALPAQSLLADRAVDKTPASTGALVLGGGGRPYNNEVLDAFFQLAGGKKARIAVIPTAHPDMDSPERTAYRVRLVTSPWEQRKAADVTVLHTLFREEANCKEFVAPLASATGVWLSGGDQSRLLACYRDTALHRGLLALLKRGGTIGGSSAGTAVQSELAIVGERNGRTLVQSGFNFLPHTIVDQHFLARSRQQRLERAVRENRDTIGLGIDEHTALVVQGGEMHVVGVSTVSRAEVRDNAVTWRSYRRGEKVPAAG